MFSPRHAPHTKRHFCGFCGTPLTHWSEHPREEAEWISINLGTLEDESLALLDESGILPSIDGDADQKTVGDAMVVDKQISARGMGGRPWFEEMIEGSELGRLRKLRGGQTSADGRTKIEWEVVEFESDDTDGEVVTGQGKRKLGEVIGDELHLRG